MRPNFVYFICHDLGRHLACYGDETVPSPNLDAMAGSGVRFTHFFAASTACSPARGCLMTGRHAHEQGLMGLVNRGWDYAGRPRTTVHDLNDAGYFTQLIGLQHESPALEKLGYQGVWSESARADRVADKAVEFLGSRSPADGPFFLSLATGEVHLPFDHGRYQFDDPAEVALPAFLPDNQINRRQMGMFHGAIRFMDQHFGRILAALDDSPLGAGTIVVFTTDHGMAFPRAKSTLYDPGIGVAMIVRMPPGAGRGGQVRDELLSGIDLRPTLCELAGVPVGGEVSGRSFAPLLTGGDYRPREEIFSEKNFHKIFDPIRCVRTREYKYIRNFRDVPQLILPLDVEKAFPPESLRPDCAAPRAAEELYELGSDAGEEKNLTGCPERAAAAAELRRRLDEWMERTGDPILSDRDIPYPPEQFP